MMADDLELDPRQEHGYLDFESSPVPVLRLQGAMWDPVALDTWREALSSLVRPEVPHELMGMWLFAGNGEAVLVGPADLAADHIAVPLPDPQVDPPDLWRLEGRVRDAGYGSALSMAVPHGERDVGLVLLATLESDRYHDREVSFLRGMVAGLGATMARVAQQWDHQPSAEHEGEKPLYRRRDEPGRALHELRDLMADLADTVAISKSPASLSAGLSHALTAAVPHDRLEIVVPQPSRNDFYRLSAHEEGALFSHRELSVKTENFDAAGLFGEDGVLVVVDATSDSRGPIWPSQEPASESVKAVVGSRLGTESSLVGYLLLGSLGPGMYGDDDVEVLKTIAPLIAPRVQEFCLDGQVRTLRAHLGVLRQAPSHMGRMAELLATTAHLGVATRLFAEEANTVLPFERMEFALRAGRDAEVVVLTPGDSRPLSDLPAIEVSGTELGRVLQSEITHALAASSQPSDPAAGRLSAALVVPLRVAGRVLGTMTLVATGDTSFGQADVMLAQQLADIAAPHLELYRRAALSSESSGSRRRIGRQGSDR
jgi:GAF domain-containing protein